MGEELQFCTNCKKNVSRHNLTVHTVHCQRNIIACSMCKEPVPKSQYQQHVETEHSSIQCQGCGTPVEAENLFGHQNEECPKRLLACEFCELEVTACDLELHLEACGARTDRCKGCTKYVMFKHLQFHYEHDHRYLSPEEKEQAEVEGKEGDEGEECPVCLGPVTLPLTLECGHLFCMVCVKGIANTTKNCAICRRDIHRDMLMDIRFCREEDIIKNYVNNPKYKKTTRSRSVPSRRVGITTKDYDNMVSALMSSRTSSSNYRYQRPNNGHTPSPYTPYCYATANTTSSTTSTQSPSSKTSSSSAYLNSYKDDDCCCCSSKDTSTTSSTTTTTSSTSKTSSTTSSSSPTPLKTYSSSNSTKRPAPIASTKSSGKSTSCSASSSSTDSAKPISSTTSSIKSSIPSSSSCSSLAPTNKTATSTSSTSSPTTSTHSSKVAPPRPTPPTSESTTSYSNSVSSTRSASATPLSSISSSSSSQDRPRRPTSLALQTDDKPNQPSGNNAASEKAPPQHLSQVEYDRWLAFQLAQAEDEVSAAEFNKNHRSPFRRSRSMPERKDDSKNFGEDESPTSRTEISKAEVQSRLPPTSPRCTSVAPSIAGNYVSNSSARGSSLTKSSSDSSANGNNSSSTTSSAISTGARPKSSTGLKKRVSFKEETPSVRRQAPVMLPCEFCEEVFPERDLMRHQTSCDENETKNPREYLLSRRSSVTSPLTSPTSPTAPSGFGSSRPSAALTTSFARASESPARSTSQVRSLRTPPLHSPSPRPQANHSPVTPPRSPSSCTSPQPTSTLSEGYYSPFDSRHASISPGPGVSVSSSSSGVSSGVSSINSSSVSTTPSTSSSASPIPAVTQPSTPGTPTDIEVDFEEEDSTFFRPRKGKLISSAISSWRSISRAKPRDQTKYIRSNTAPLEVRPDDELQLSVIATSKSAALLRAPSSHDDFEGETQETKEEKETKESSQEVTPTVFIRNKNKYPAPPPPQPTNIKNTVSDATEHTSQQCISSITLKFNEAQKETHPIKYAVDVQQETNNKGGIFKFDSVPVMNGRTHQRDTTDILPCEFCKKVFSPETFRAHQTLCKAEQEPQSKPNHSRTEESKEDCQEQKSNTPAKRNKGPAPNPPSESETPKRRPIERSHSVRESSSESKRSKEFESSGRRLERTCSIKEGSSRFKSRPNLDSPPRQGLSREGFYGSSLDCSAAYSAGGSLASSNTSLNSYTGGHGWSSHINMIRDEARSRRTSYIYAAAPTTTTPYYGASRYRDRSVTRHRPSSLYSSSIRSTIYI